MRVIVSHTEGEPTRLVIDGGPPLGGGPLAELHDRAYEDPGLVVAAAKRSLKEAGGDCFVVYPSLATFETVLERVA